MRGRLRAAGCGGVVALAVGVVVVVVVAVGGAAGAAPADGRAGAGTKPSTSTKPSTMADGDASPRIGATWSERAQASPRSTTTSTAAPRASPRWSWPLAPLRMLRAYEPPPSPYAAGHRGIDLAAPPGAIVTSPSDATVHFVGVVVDRPVLTLDHGSGVLSSYEPVVAEGLAVGDPVTRGMPLGVVGEGAHCSGACLHVGVRVDGEYVSPLLFFERPPRSVLLPLRPGPATSAAPRGRPVRRGDGRCGRSP